MLPSKSFERPKPNSSLSDAMNPSRLPWLQIGTFVTWIKRCLLNLRRRRGARSKPLSGWTDGDVIGVRRRDVEPNGHFPSAFNQGKIPAEVGEFQRWQSALIVAEEITWATELEVRFRDFEPI